MSDTTKLYLIEHYEAPWWFNYKVGIASDPEQRLKQLQVGNPIKLELALEIALPSRALAAKIERDLHKALAKSHLHGEWFRAIYDEILPILLPIIVRYGPEIGISSEAEARKLLQFIEVAP